MLLVEQAAGHVADVDGINALDPGILHGSAAGRHGQLANRSIPLLANGRLPHA
jgi:hypothetical protein